MRLAFPSHPIYRAATAANHSPVGVLRFLRSLSLATTAILLLSAIITTESHFVGFASLTLVIFIVCFLWLRFVTFYENRGLIPLGDTQAEAWLDVNSRWMTHIDFASIQLLARTGSPDPVAFASALFSSDIGAFFSRRTGISVKELMSEVTGSYRTPAPELDIAHLALKAASSAQKSKNPFITPADFFAAFAESEERINTMFMKRDFKGSDFDHIANWIRIQDEHRPQSFLEHLLSAPGVGKQWAYAYAPFLEQMTSSIWHTREDELHIRAHRESIRLIGESLSQTSAANVLLVGEPGVGKATVIQGFSDAVRKGESLGPVNFRSVRRLNMEDIISQPSFGTIEATIGRVFHEAEAAGNLILVIEDIENYLSKSAPTHVAEGLLPFFRSPLIKVIGITTPEGFAKAASEYPTLKTMFHEIRIEEPDEETTMMILADASLALERRFRCAIQYQSLRSVYDLSRQYLTSSPFPEKGVGLLEEVFTAAAAVRARVITERMVEEVVGRKVGTVVASPGSSEGALLLNLEDRIHQRVINQEEGIKAIADAVRRKRSGISSSGRPVGSFLFLGPTGVGKTETAKALAESYFGSDEAMIRLDMSEYQNPGDIARLIGSRDTDESGFLAREIRARPFSLLLLDEIEKAHTNILDLFLQILDEGHAKDAYDKKIDFTNALIVATSNAGSEFIRESLKLAVPYPELQAKLIDEVLKKGIFRPEFLNRFDGVIVFTPLSFEHVKKVAELMLRELSRRLEERGYRLAWSEELVAWLAERGYSQVFGGRALRRVVQDTLESSIAKEILAGSHPKGSTITITTPPPVGGSPSL